MVDVKLAKAALELTADYAQGAAKDRVVQAFFAGVATCAPDLVTPAEIMAVAISGAGAVEKWAHNGHNPPPKTE